MKLAENVRAAPDRPVTADQRRTAGSAHDWALLLIRLTVGLIMAGHGAQKLFGMFGGPGVAATGRNFAGLGYHPGDVYAVIGGASELLGGLGLALGLLTPLASAAIIGTMINAMVTVSGAHGLWQTDGGVEYSVVLSITALGIAAIGPGRFALDRAFRWGRGGWRAAGVALFLGGIGAAVVLAL